MKACTLNHVGVGVADVDAAIDWYRQVFGFKLVREPFEVRHDESPEGEQAVDILGATFRHMRMAHMATGDGVGIELFQLIDPPHERRDPTLQYWRSGVFHFCVTVDDIEAATARLIEHGGRQRSKIWLNAPPDPRRKTVYCEDPWGTIIELYTHRYADMYA